MIFVHMCMFIYTYACIPVYVDYIASMISMSFFYLPKRMTNLAFEGAEASEEDLQVAEGEAKAEP